MSEQSHTRPGASRRKTVFLACPYGQVGGGMGSIMAYLVSLETDPGGRFELKRLESRGSGHIAASPFYLMAAIGRIFREAAAGRLAVVHLNLAERGSVYRKAALLAATKLAGGRVLLHLHAAQIVQFHSSLNRVGRLLLLRMFRSADHCVVLGNVWERWVTETFKLEPGRVSVVYNGVPATRPVARTRPDDGKFRLLFVGNLLERKGVKDLLQAFASPALMARDIALTMAGGGPVDAYRQVATDLGIAQRVAFTGWVSQDDARSLMVNADALILPAYDEGLPLVILEALASRTPVICTPVGSIPEVLKHGDTALFVAPGDVASIVEAITALIDSPATCAELAANGEAIYRRLFTMDAFAQSIGSLYAALTQRNSTGCRSMASPVQQAGK